MAKPLSVDISAGGHPAARSTHLLWLYAQADWRMRPLVMVIKEWAAAAAIRNTSRNYNPNKLSSYSIELMVIFFLQFGLRQPFLPTLQRAHPEWFNPRTHFSNLNYGYEVKAFRKDQGQLTLGELLKAFLKFYSEFDFDKNVVSVRIGRLLTKTEEFSDKAQQHRRTEGTNVLCIEEPLYLLN